MYNQTDITSVEDPKRCKNNNATKDVPRHLRATLSQRLSIEGGEECDRQVQKVAILLFLFLCSNSFSLINLQVTCTAHAARTGHFSGEQTSGINLVKLNKSRWHLFRQHSSAGMTTTATP